MTWFFNTKISLGPRSIVNLLLTPISELGLSDVSCEFLSSCHIHYCYDLLELPKEKLFAKLGSTIPNVWFGRLTPIIFEIRKIIWRLERYGFRMGMLEGYIMLAIQFTESVNERKNRENKLVGNSLRLGAGNHHPANPRSQVNYDGSISNGEW